MADVTLLNLRGLVLSANELRQLTDWPEALIEDYLSLIDNLVVLANKIDVKNDIIKNVTLVDTAMSPYEITDTDEDVFFNTDAGAIVTNLRPGTTGRNYRLVNVGSSRNDVTVNPFGVELLYGENTSEYIADQEALLMTFQVGEGWN